MLEAIGCLISGHHCRRLFLCLTSLSLLSSSSGFWTSLSSASATDNIVIIYLLSISWLSPLARSSTHIHISFARPPPLSLFAPFGLVIVFPLFVCFTGLHYFVLAIGLKIEQVFDSFPFSILVALLLSDHVFLRLCLFSCFCTLFPRSCLCASIWWMDTLLLSNLLQCYWLSMTWLPVSIISASSYPTLL